jgi:hypothetical protein
MNSLCIFKIVATFKWKVMMLIVNISAPQQAKRGKNQSIQEAPSAPHVIAEKKQNPNKP